MELALGTCQVADETTGFGKLARNEFEPAAVPHWEYGLAWVTQDAVRRVNALPLPPALPLSGFLQARGWEPAHGTVREGTG